MKIDKILLISPPRSGSQLIMTILEGPPIYTLNEIFTFHPYKIQYTGDKQDMFSDPNKYINFFLNRSDKKIALAKILINTWPEERLHKVLTNKEYRFIFIYRENLLESAVSAAAAKETGQWMAEKANYKMPDNFVVNIDDAEIRCKSFYEKTAYCLNNLPEQDSLIIKYEDLYDRSLDMSVVNKIRRFAGLNDVKAFESKFVKQNNKKTYARILNRKELEKRLGPKYGFLDSRQTPGIWNKHE